MDFLNAVGKKVSRAHKKYNLDNKTNLSPVEKQIERLTISQLVEFVEKCKEKYMKGKPKVMKCFKCLKAEQIQILESSNEHVCYRNVCYLDS